LVKATGLWWHYLSSASDLVVFGIASSGAVQQWDGHPTPTGILLRWFARSDLGYPELGFDIFRAQVPDIAPLPFNDLNVPFIQGSSSWSYADVVTLSCSAGLHFERSLQPGWWRLIITAAEPVTVKFTSPAWLVSIRADEGTSNLTITGRRADGSTIRQEELKAPGATLTWRTRGVEELELSGVGTVSFIGYHLLGHVGSWTQIAHRCLPVIDPAYRCAPQPAVSEADEAKSRLPPMAAAEWANRFARPFADLLPALQRLAVGSPPAPIPPATARSDVRLNADERALIDLASLDPHGARILGLAYDDLLSGGLDGREYVYKVVGRWLGKAVTLDFTTGRRIDPRVLKRQYGIEIDLDGSARGTPEIVVRFSQPILDFSIAFDGPSPVDWFSANGFGGAESGTLPPGSMTLSLNRLSELRLTWQGPNPPPTLTILGWTPVIERIGLLPGIVAIEPGPPPGPTSLQATVVPADSPSAITTADLDWPVTIDADDSIPEGEPVSYQIGHRRLNPNPAAMAPVPGATRRADLLYEGSPIFISASIARRLPPAGRVLHTDRNDGNGLSIGWWGWWVRGVDLFGRVSQPSPWAIAPIIDTAPPPAPVLIQAEWVQRNLPAATIAVVGRSVEARRWLQNSTANNGLVLSWVFGPDQANLRDDVDGFRLLVRRPSLPAGAATGDPLEYFDPWPKPIASFGPTPIRVNGTISANPVVDPSLTVTVTAVQQLPPAPAAKPTDPVRSACRTDLELDGASGAFTGGTIVIGASSYPIVANGDGPDLTVVIEHAAGAAAAPSVVGAAAQLNARTGKLIELTTDLPELTPGGGGGLRARSGVLIIGQGATERRLQVLQNDAGGVFLCYRDGAAAAPALGDIATWYPVWSAALDDAGFGPVANDTTPVAHAQVAVCAVRSIQASGPSSIPSAPLTVTAVDLTVPTQPDVDRISFDPSDCCVEAATRADWYGKSRFRFTMAWTTQPNRRFLVYRALGDEINRLDRLEHESGGGRAHNFANPAAWPSGVYADVGRRSRVVAELAALDAARMIADPTMRTAAVDEAYEAMTIDTQMLLARQPYAWPAYIALTTEPIETNSFEDVLDGRSRGHWFYRVISRTQAGIESAPSEPTPPICCPDVVPPSPPLAHLALADNGRVKLRWLASPDVDTDHYEVFAAQHPEAEAELRSMTSVAVHTPASHQGGVVIEYSVQRPPGEWCFWIVAVDTSGNRSAPSVMLRGKSLRAAPAAPVWQPPTRTATGVALVWTHPTNQRLACLVERKPSGGTLWRAVSTWLPRGVYSFHDMPPDLASAWEYRLRVRDHLGQAAATLPSTNLGAMP
jgi:hypothetical protein